MLCEVKTKIFFLLFSVYSWKSEGIWGPKLSAEVLLQGRADALVLYPE